MPIRGTHIGRRVCPADEAQEHLEGDKGGGPDHPPRPRLLRVARETEGTMRSLPRLLLAVDSLEVGGAERHVVDLARALRRRGYGVEVACSVPGGLAEPLQAAGVPV